MMDNKWKSRLRFLSTLVFWSYLGFLIILPFLWMTFAESQWLLVLLRFAPPLCYLAGLVLVSFTAWLFRVRRFHYGAAAGFFIVMMCYMDFQLHFSDKKAPASISVMSFNIHAGTGGEDAIGSFLAGSDCDIIGLQEARKPLLADLPDPVPTISTMLPGYTLNRGGSRGELVTLSRYPLVSAEEHPLDDLSTCTDVVVDVDGRKLRVMNVHFMTGDPKNQLKGQGLALKRRVMLSARTRHLQAGALRDLISKSELPVVITGDFNTPPDSVAYRILSRDLKDSFCEAGSWFGFTCRANLPLWRIDYIWTRNLTVSRCRTLSPGLSDHKAVQVFCRF